MTVNDIFYDFYKKIKKHMLLLSGTRMHGRRRAEGGPHARRLPTSETLSQCCHIGSRGSGGAGWLWDALVDPEIADAHFGVVCRLPTKHVREGRPRGSRHAGRGERDPVEERWSGRARVSRSREGMTPCYNRL
jgi:hypothetical protein